MTHVAQLGAPEAAAHFAAAAVQEVRMCSQLRAQDRAYIYMIRDTCWYMLGVMYDRSAHVLCSRCPSGSSEPLGIAYGG